MVSKDRMAALLQVLSSYAALDRIAIQTNGTLIDQSWLELFAELAPSIEWGVSFDGLGDYSSLRQTHDGEASWMQTVRGIEQLEGSQIRYGLITVVTSRHTEHPMPREFLAGLDSFSYLTNLKLVPCLDGPQTAPSRRQTVSAVRQRAGLRPGAPPSWAVSPNEFHSFVEVVERDWINRGHWRRYRLDPIASVVENLLGRGSNYSDFSGGSDADVVTLYPDETIAINDRSIESMSGEADLSAIGDVRVYLAKRRSQLADEWHREYLPMCSPCPAWDGCGGSELYMRRSLRESSREEEFCHGRRQMVANVKQLLASIGRAQPTRKAAR